MLKQLGVGAAITAALFFGGWLYGQHQYRQGADDTIKDMRLAAYDQYRSEVERMASASWELQNIITELQYAKPKVITKYKEVVVQTPLPDACRIDDERLRRIQSAVREATATR